MDWIPLVEEYSLYDQQKGSIACFNELRACSSLACTVRIYRKIVQILKKKKPKTKQEAHRP